MESIEIEVPMESLRGSSSTGTPSYLVTPNKSYFFVERTGDSIDDELDEFIVGYTRNIDNWVLKYHMPTSRYVVIFRTNSELGAKELWQEVQRLLKLNELPVREAQGPTGIRQKHTFPTILLPWKDLKEILKLAMLQLQLPVTVYHGLPPDYYIGGAAQRRRN